MIISQHPYSCGIEEAIYLFAIGQSALPAPERTASVAKGALDYLEYLGESYAQAEEGAPTAMMYPQWGVRNVNNNALVHPQPRRDMSEAKNRHGGRLYVNGLPTWALQFQISLLAFQLGNSTPAMAAMENAFMCYETWLPRLEYRVSGK